MFDLLVVLLDYFGLVIINSVVICGSFLLKCLVCGILLVFFYCVVLRVVCWLCFGWCFWIRFGVGFVACILVCFS